MEKLEAKLKAVDWAVRDVLVGTMRSPQQLDICRKHCFYYIPAERLQDSDFPVRYVALYQSQYVFQMKSYTELAASPNSNLSRLDVTLCTVSLYF